MSYDEPDWSLVGILRGLIEGTPATFSVAYSAPESMWTVKVGGFSNMTMNSDGPDFETAVQTAIAGIKARLGQA